MSNTPNPLDKLLHHLDEIHATDVVVLDVKEQTSVTDYMIIATGRSSRHTKSIASIVMEKMKAENLPPLGYHGMEDGEWVLVDFGDYVLHIMQPESRDFYDLEGLWQEK